MKSSVMVTLWIHHRILDFNSWGSILNRTCYVCVLLSWRQPWVMLSRSTESSRVCFSLNAGHHFTFSFSYCICCGNSRERRVGTDGEHRLALTSRFAHRVWLSYLNFGDAARAIVLLCWHAARDSRAHSSLPCQPVLCPLSLTGVVTLGKTIIPHFSGNWGEVQFYDFFFFTLTAP